LFASRAPKASPLFSDETGKYLNKEQLITVMAKVVEQLSNRSFNEKDSSNEKDKKFIIITNEDTLSCSKYGE